MPTCQVNPVIDPTVRGLCTRAYPGHPRGCPNFGSKPGCPPQAPLLADVLMLDMPVFAVWNVFDLAGHVERLRAKHPTWSNRQLVCCLYWQPMARIALRWEIRQLIRGPYRLLRVVTCPEAMGVNVTETMRAVGVELEWPPVKRAVQVALAGTVKTGLPYMGGL